MYVIDHIHYICYMVSLQWIAKQIELQLNRNTAAFNKYRAQWEMKHEPPFNSLECFIEQLNETIIPISGMYNPWAFLPYTKLVSHMLFIATDVTVLPLGIIMWKNLNLLKTT